MKLVVYFAFVAVMAFEVSSSENSTDGSDHAATAAHKYGLEDAIPRDIGLPLSPDFHSRKLPKGRIVGGVEISQKERSLYKHQVGLHFDDSFWCGGSIVSPRCIITAAHCVEKMHRANVFIGLYDKSRITPDTQVIQITSNNWRQHEGYNDKTLVNDLAIINLPNPMKFGDFVGPIAIECDDRQRHENEVVRISGWGKHSDSDSDRTTVLRAARVMTAPEETCRNVFGVGINKAMLCVDAKNSIGTCQGDSGGPVVAESCNKLLGATSFGAVGCNQPLPRIFTRLSSHRQWMHDNSVDHLC